MLWMRLFFVLGLGCVSRFNAMTLRHIVENAILPPDGGQSAGVDICCYADHVFGEKK